MTPSLTAPIARHDGIPNTAYSAAAPLPYTPRLSRLSLAGVALAHAGLLAALLLAVADKANTVTPPRPLMVSLIEAEQPEPQPEPEHRPTPPQPVVKPQTPPPMLVARRATPTPQAVIEAPRPDPKPEPVPEILPRPALVVTETSIPAPPTPPRSADYLNNPKPLYPRLSTSCAKKAPSSRAR